MTSMIRLSHHFLIAMPAVEDPFFAKTVVYIAEHNDQGAIGIIVNRPIDGLMLSTLFKRIEVAAAAEGFADAPVFLGGPVQTERGFVLHRPLGAWQSTLAINAEFGLTTSRDVLQSVGRTGHPSQRVVTLGYSGWGSGQLEHEIGQNAWLTVPADPRVLFELPCEERWNSAMELLGIDPANLAGQAGHA